MGLIEAIKKYNLTNPISNVENSDAFTYFLNNGIPTNKDEEWKYTSLKQLVSNDFSVEAKGEEISQDELDKSTLKTKNQIIFLNGEMVKKPEIDGVLVTSYTDKNPSFEDAFTALNAAYANNGYRIHVEKNVHLKDSIEVIFLSKNTTNNFIQYRNRIDLNENSSIKIIEHFKCLDKNLCFTNSLTNINLDKSSNIEFNKLQNHNDFQIVVDNTIINQDEKSYSTINTLLLGGKFTRNNLSFYQNGEHCESNMNGVVILNNNEFGDNHTYVDHKNANCESNELYKGVYLDKSKGVFNGKIMVRPDAQKINAFQANNNLLLSENSSINSKPQLEIYADDVKCSHGCTIGQLDDDALFYMRTRGINKEDAKTILTFAFASEAIEKLTIDELADITKKEMEKKLNLSLN
ncbi:Fe-S cluster assembly protein SufD [bacterium]|nr:Fe-S cluster assembly protein SufD [bacterium]